MSINLIAYWRNWVKNNEDISITIDGYILKYSMVNQFSNVGVRNWVCCISKKKLYSFIKYLLLPSVIITKYIGIEEQEVYFDVCDYDEAIQILEFSEVKGYEKAIETFSIWFEEIEELEEKDLDFENLRSFINKVSLEVEYSHGLYLELELFENIRSVGKTLIKEYEAEGTLAILENIMELSKEKTANLFENFDENEFMLKKITTLLNERFK
ncbi:hypothetical protein [Clostridium sp.]|uniref:hypothetical protein n=1 Tax=Clostridium sp. TaxID=1506 RepID=UPI002FC8B1A8